MNLHAVKAIYRFEMARMWRTAVQSLVAPVLSTSLYFVIFGGAIGSRIPEIEGVSYGAFIVPGLIMLSIMTESISNSSFAIYFPRFTGTVFEVLSAPVSWVEVLLGYVGAAATKSVIIGTIIFVTANFFVTIDVAHPFLAITFLILTSVSFCLFGFILGVWADGWEKLTIVPILVIMPLSFLGGIFYSIGMLPPLWQNVSLLNPLVYLISGFRWSFYQTADVSIVLSLGMTGGFLLACVLTVRWIFKTGYRLRT
ncbi:MAG: ABC transporter permease [Pseudomonadota bacterium]